MGAKARNHKVGRKRIMGDSNEFDAPFFGKGDR